MTASRIAALVVLVVVGSTFAPVVGAVGTAGDARGTASDTRGTASDTRGTASDTKGAMDENPNETTMGAEVSAFMHSNAAGLGEAVDDGMFDASYERADEEERREVVADRTNHLRERLTALEDERETLEANEDELSTPTYNARMVRLTVEIAALERSINETESRAVEVGVDTTEIESLRSDVAALAGPDVARIATGIVGLDSSSSLIQDWSADDEDAEDSLADGIEPGNVTDGNATDGNVTDGNTTENATDGNATENTTTDD